LIKKLVCIEQRVKKKKLTIIIVLIILKRMNQSEKSNIKNFKKVYNMWLKCERICHYPNNCKIVKISIKYTNKL